jgi:uncharacterized protein DUF6932
MLPDFDRRGNLPPGIHFTDWPTFRQRFAGTSRRATLLAGLRQALFSLATAGCNLAYIDGSFVTSKPEPGDYDACWSVEGVDEDRLDPVFLTFDDGRAAQKARFGGELFPAELPEGISGRTFLEFFQTDKETGARKGIVAIALDVEQLLATEPVRPSDDSNEQEAR